MNDSEFGAAIEDLKSLPDDTESNHLGNLPFVSD